MKTKFKDSNIKIAGEITIKSNNDFVEIGYGEIHTIPITGSKGKTKSGVYELVNKINGKRYIGMARNLENRYNRHIRDLIAGQHCNQLIQGDFNIAHINNVRNEQYSSKETFKDMFEFRVIIYCRPSELTFYEHLLITHLNPEYNIHKQKEIEFKNSPEDEESSVSDEIYSELVKLALE